jgi:hypothetical protein
MHGLIQSHETVPLIFGGFSLTACEEVKVGIDFCWDVMPSCVHGKIGLLLENSVLTNSVSSVMFWPDEKRFKSSANSELRRAEESGELLMYIKKSKGPKMDLWGTPRSIFRSELLCP